MGQVLDWRLGVAETNAVFWKAPGVFCLPLVLVGLVLWSATELQLHFAGGKGHLLLGSIPTFAGLIADFCATVMAMAADASGGVAPELAKAFGIFRYDGLWATIGQLTGRLIGWGMAVFGGTSLVWLMWVLVVSVVRGATHHKATAAGHSWLGLSFAMVVLLLGVQAAMAQYSLALPLLVVRRGSGEDLVKLSRHLVHGVAGVFVWLSLLGGLPVSLFVIVNAALKHHSVSTPVHLLAGIVRVVVVSSVASWFSVLLVRLTTLRMRDVVGTPERVMGR